MTKFRKRKHNPSDISRNDYNPSNKIEENSSKSRFSQERNSKSSVNTKTDKNSPKSPQRREKFETGKPSLIDLNINMNSLNEMLK